MSVASRYKLRAPVPPPPPLVVEEVVIAKKKRGGRKKKEVVSDIVETTSIGYSEDASDGAAGEDDRRFDEIRSEGE